MLCLGVISLSQTMSEEYLNLILMSIKKFAISEFFYWVMRKISLLQPQKKTAL